jgi:glycosyltransferase involved in cell wall biosynthesis
MVHPLPEYRGLRIALVSETFPPEINGVSMTLGRLVQGLALRGHALQVVRCRRPREPSPEPQPGITQLALPSLPIPRYQGLRLGLPARGRLREAWTRERPDVVHIATEGPLGHSALRAAEDLGLPLASSFHTNFDDYARHYRIGLLAGIVKGHLRRFHNRTRVTMAPSVDLVERLRGEGYHNLVTLGRGVDTTLFSPAKRDPALRATWGAGEADPVLLHVGRVAPEKNIPLALETFARIQRANPRARMVVVGDGPLRSGLATAHPQVHFTGALPVADLARHYASADVFLFPSMSETFGNVLLEAMASGLATVSFDYAAPQAYVRHGDNGLLAAFGDEAEWQDLATDLLADPRRIKRLGEHARHTANTIGWDAVINRFEELLRGVADGTLTVPSPRLHTHTPYWQATPGAMPCISPTSPATNPPSASAPTASTAVG